MYTGSMFCAGMALNEQALKAYSNLLSVFDKIKFDVRTKLSIFLV